MSTISMDTSNGSRLFVNVPGRENSPSTTKVVKSPSNSKLVLTYLHPDFFDSKSCSSDLNQSPLALLAETCNNIGKDASQDKAASKLSPSELRSSSRIQSSRSSTLSPCQYACDLSPKSDNSKHSPNLVSPSNKSNSSTYSDQTKSDKNGNFHVKKPSSTSSFNLLSSKTMSASKRHEAKSSRHSPQLSKSSPVVSSNKQSVTPGNINQSHKLVSEKPVSNSLSSVAVESAAAAALNLAATSAYFAAGNNFPYPPPFFSNVNGPNSNIPPAWMGLNNLRPAMPPTTGSTGSLIPADTLAAYSNYFSSCHVPQGPCFCVSCIQQKLMTDSLSLYNHLPGFLANSFNNNSPTQAVPESLPPCANTSLPSKTVSTGKKAYTAEYCMYCGKHCPSEEDLLTHMQLHLNANPSLNEPTQSPPLHSQKNLPMTMPGSMLSPSQISPQQQLMPPSSTSLANLAAFGFGIYPGFDLTRKLPNSSLLNGTDLSSSFGSMSHRFHPFRPPLPSRLAANMNYSYGTGLV